MKKKDSFTARFFKKRSKKDEQSSGQRWLSAILLWFQDSESADRSGSPGAGLWAVTTDTQTNQELSLKQYRRDCVTGDWKNRIARRRGCVFVLTPVRVCANVCFKDHTKANAEAHISSSRH